MANRSTSPFECSTAAPSASPQYQLRPAQPALAPSIAISFRRRLQMHPAGCKDHQHTASHSPAPPNHRMKTHHILAGSTAFPARAFLINLRGNGSSCTKIPVVIVCGSNPQHREAVCPSSRYSPVVINPLPIPFCSARRNLAFQLKLEPQVVPHHNSQHPAVLPAECLSFVISPLPHTLFQIAAPNRPV